MIKKIYIVLEDGHIFEGKSFGAEGEALGELVFTTGMGGYIETLTDPSYYGQIVMQTFPLIGNYGIMEEDFESDRSYVSSSAEPSGNLLEAVFLYLRTNLLSPHILYL